MRTILLVCALLSCACRGGEIQGVDQPVVVGLQEVASGLSDPLYVTSPPGDSRLFVVEKGGRIRIIKNGQLLTTPFLDITPRVATGSEQGLLSLAFHPSYRTNGFFYINFKDPDRITRVERYSVSSNPDVANAASSKLILTYNQLFANHNGGLNLFGPDGMLYIGTGDGGSGGDPDGNGQNLGTLLGKILRLDVDHGDPYLVPADNPFATRAGARPEIWAYGLRNPWRFSFDRVGGVLYIADVGQDRFEEINAVASNAGGLNYGWNTMEGSSCYNAASCSQTGLQMPIVVYDHSGGCSVTGGYVYRGSVATDLVGLYFYSDYCSGFLKSFRLQNGVATEQQTYDIGNIGSITSFGEDSSGEIYMTSSNGRVYKIVTVG